MSSTNQPASGDQLDPESDDDLEGRYDCRAVYPNFRFEADGTEHGEEEPPTSSYRCGSWDCYCCGYRMRMNLVEEVADLVDRRPEMRRFLTLTLDPSKLTDGDLEKVAEDDDAEIDEDAGEYVDRLRARYLMETWRKFRIYVRREYGDFSFVWVKERGEENEDHWHLHVLVSRYLDQAWISEAWSAVGGGEVVDIRRVSRCEKVAHYLGKYLTKNALSEFPDGIQRYGTSEDIDLDVRGDSDSERDFSLVMDDYTFSDEEPLTRAVASADFVAQRLNGGPVGKGPPD